MNDSVPPDGGASQSSSRAKMAAEIRCLDSAARAQRLAIRFGNPGHVEDEVVTTLMLESWRTGQEQECSTYSAEVLRRVTRHVRAHVRKNPGWQRLGGGAETAIEDFCSAIVLAILQDNAVPCHAEVAFGNYVYRRCVDEAGKLYAKKHSAGRTLEDDGECSETSVQGPDDDLPADTLTPEQAHMEFEEVLAEQATLERIRNIAQKDLPELPSLAFTFRYLAGLKIESKKPEEVTVTRLMGVNEKTATKYINQAIAIIKQRLET